MTRTLAAATCTWTGSWDIAPSATTDAIVVSGGGNLDWSNTMPQAVASWSQAEGYSGTVTFHTAYGPAGFTNFAVTGNAAVTGGVWTHLDNGTSAVNCLRVSIGGDFTLGTNGRIDANGLGYDAIKGPGQGSQVNAKYYQGASHGGLGGFSREDAAYMPSATYITYGSITAPINLGSGGSVAGLSGGGAIFLDVAGMASIDGTIRANAPFNNTINGTSGAGGSVFIRAADIASSGAAIEAKGGASAQAHGSSVGGGGGRIAIIVTNGVSIDPDLTFDARGGTAYFLFQQAAAGSIYTETSAQSGGHGRLIIDNYNVFTGHDFAKTICTPEVNYTNFSEIVIRNKGNLGIDGDDTFDFATANLTVQGPSNSAIHVTSGSNVTFGANIMLNGYTLIADGITNIGGNLTITNAILTHSRQPDLGTQELFRINLTIWGDLTIHTNGAIDANGKGYYAGKGPGGGNRENPNQGGSHGGLGSLNGTPTATFVTYGSIMAPSNNGSGCGGNWSADTRNNGGGAILLNVQGNTVLDGGIRARATGNTANPTGSGGSVLLTTDSLSGSGTIDVSPEANGQPNTYAHGGGGGRIAVVLHTGNDFGGVRMIACGGDGYENRDGAAGTVYRQTQNQGVGRGKLIVDNNGYVPFSASTRTVLNGSNTDNLRHVPLIVTNGAVLVLASNQAIADLLVHTNSFLVLSNFTLTIGTTRHNLENASDPSPGPVYRVDHYDQIIWARHGSMLRIE